MTLIPSVDEDVLPAQPHTLIASGQGAHVPLLAGTTRDEWNFFVLLTDPKRLTLDAAGLHKVFARRIPGRGEEVLAVYTAGLPGDEVPWKVFAAMETDRMFRIPSIRMAEAHARHAPAFMYRLDYGSPLFDGELGACHAIDIPFMFDAVQSKAGVALTGGGEAAAQLAGRMADAWAAFARDGAPGHEGLPDWPAYECSGRATLVLNETCELVQDPMGAERQVWDQIQ